MLDSAPHSPDSESNLTDDRSSRLLALTFGAVFAAMSVLAGFDVAFDFQDKLSLKHELVEDGVLFVGIIGLAITGLLLARSLRRERQLRDEATRSAARWQKRELELEAASVALAQQLEVSELETSRWKREAGDMLAGLGVAIAAQFERWVLTPAECEVALLLLKGLSHKEIAGVRHVGETTVRQQAQGIYRKSGLANRNDLAAFFLEDLLLPSRSAESARLDAQ